MEQNEMLTPDEELDAIKAELAELPLPVSVDSFLDTPHLDHEQKTLRELIREGPSDIMRIMMNEMWLEQLKKLLSRHEKQLASTVDEFLHAPHPEYNNLSHTQLIEKHHCGPPLYKIYQHTFEVQRHHDFEQPASSQWPTAEELHQWDALLSKEQKNTEELQQMLCIAFKYNQLIDDLATVMDGSFVHQWLFHRPNEAFGGKIPWEALKDGSISIDDLQAMFYRLATGMPT